MKHVEAENMLANPMCSASSFLRVCFELGSRRIYVIYIYILCSGTRIHSPVDAMHAGHRGQCLFGAGRRNAEASCGFTGGVACWTMCCLDKHRLMTDLLKAVPVRQIRSNLPLAVWQLDSNAQALKVQSDSKALK